MRHAETGARPWWRHLVSTDHKVIGLQYLVISLVFLVAGSLLALLIRWELADPQATLDPDAYNQTFTMHGTIMIFFAAIPLLTGAFGNYIVPLQIGARDMALPRVNALSVWIFLVSGLFSMTQFVVPGGPSEATWLAYPPLSAVDSFSTSGLGKTIWAASLILMGFSSILSALNVLVTVVALRAPGVTWGRLPVFTWALFLTSILVVLVIPFLSGALLLLVLDQGGGFGFFLPAAKGSPLLWEHLFWFFGHPEVYIALLPLYGIVGEVLPPFSRKTLYGHHFLVGCMAATTALSFLVWGHHMYTSGMNPVAAGFFMLWTKMISVPAGAVLLCFVATLWRGDLRFEPPLLFAMMFIVAFVLGGLSGFFNATIPVDLYVHDTYWVVGHFHMVLVTAAVAAIFAGLYYWWPKMTGKLLHAGLGKLHFWGTSVLMLAIFSAMHLVGLAGMRRHIAVYSAEYAVPNAIISYGSFLLVAFQLPFVANLLWSLFRGSPAGANPWGALTLEWQTSSPPPHGNFPRLPEPIPAPYGYGTPAEDPRPEAPASPAPLPHPHAPASPLVGRLGMWVFLFADAMMFAALVATYAMLRSLDPAWPDPQARLDVNLTGVFTFVLICSSVTMVMALAASREGNLPKTRAYLALTILGGLGFLGFQSYEWGHFLTEGAGPRTDLFYATFFTLTGFHGFHVASGLGLLAWILFRSRSNLAPGRYAQLVECCGLYWHFVDLVWVLLFTGVYLV